MKTLKFTGTILSAGLIALILYVFLHEAGHTIAALACGAQITDFSILTAHMSASGGTFTSLPRMWLHGNGALLPVISADAAMLFYNKKSARRWYKVFAFFIGLIPNMSMTAWILIPFLYINGNAPAGDDVTLFLTDFPGHPLGVSAAAACIMALGIFIGVKKGIVSQYVQYVKTFRS